MASGDPQRQLSLVPYAPETREVVLRHGNAAVVWDPLSKELWLRKTSTSTGELTDCPFCHRPLQDSTPSFRNDEGVAGNDDRAFVNPEYFRMLAHSIPNSPNSSRPPSPLKQLPAWIPGGGRPAAASRVPSEADFVESTPAPEAAKHGIRGSSFLPNYFKSFFVEKRELGRGGRGVVLLVEHVLDGVFLGEFACKRIPVGNDHGWLEKVLIEVQLLQRLNHQNLVSYQHVWLEDAQVTNFGPSVPCIFILQQYCNAGDLHDYVLKTVNSKPAPETLKERIRRRSRGQAEQDVERPRRMHFDEIFSFFRDITSGLNHLHQSGYIHRDLKPSNCLLHRTGNRLTVHVSDFGEVQATTDNRSSTGATGTISYCAPEVLQRETPGGRFANFTTKSDIFSLGMCVYFMCFGRLPYANADSLDDANEDIDQLRAEVSSWRGFDSSTRPRSDLPEKLYKFLRTLLSPDPMERPSTEQILSAIKGEEDIDAVPPRKPADLDRPPGGPRITVVDSPAPLRTTTSNGLFRRPSAHGPSPSPPSSSHPERRHSSSDAARPASTSRSRGNLRASPHDTGTISPPSEPHLSPRTTSTDSGAVLRTRKVYLPPTAAEDELFDPSAVSPSRLLLPPPPPPPASLAAKAALVLRNPAVLLAFRALAFFVKVATLAWPCAPYAVRPVVLYVGMGVAVLDFVVRLGFGGSLVLLAVHLVGVRVAAGWGVLCCGG